MSDCLPPQGLQHARLPFPLPTPRAYSSSCPSHEWCHSTISSFVIPFSSCLQSFSALESFLMSRLFTSNDQTLGASASVLVLPMNIQSWFHLGLIGLISLLSKGLSRVFSSNTFQKHNSLALRPLCGSTHICTWILRNHSWTIWTCVSKVMFLLLIHCLGMSYLFFQGASVF